MEITWKTLDHILMVKICGDIDHHTCEMLRQQVDQALESTNSRSILFSFAQVSFMDSSGIALILRSQQRMQLLEGSVVLRNIPAQARRVLDAAGIGRLVSIK